MLLLMEMTTYDDLTIEDVTKIGTTPVHVTHRAWLAKFRQKTQPTQEQTSRKIAALTQEGAFDAGCNFLLHWNATKVIPTPSNGDVWSDLVVDYQR